MQKQLNSNWCWAAAPGGRRTVLWPAAVSGAGVLLAGAWARLCRRRHVARTAG